MVLNNDRTWIVKTPKSYVSDRYIDYPDFVSDKWASIPRALGIPDSYIMQCGGLGNDGTLKAVYRHALADKAKEMNEVANDYFTELYNTK